MLVVYIFPLSYTYLGSFFHHPTASTLPPYSPHNARNQYPFIPKIILLQNIYIKMCRYRVVTFRCDHKRKTPIPTCDLKPECTDEQAELLERTRDLSDVRAAIRLHHADRNSPEYAPLMDRICNHYASFFGHRSTNGDDVMASLEDIERYVDGEIQATARNVTERVESEYLCAHRCWEGLVILGREAQELGSRGDGR